MTPSAPPSDGPRRIEPRRALLALASWLPFAALVAFGVRHALALSSHPALANHDVGWTLHAGERLLDGGRYGETLFDPNPPLIYWITAAVSGVGRAIDVPSLTLYNLLVLVLAIASGVACGRLARRVPGAASPPIIALVVCAVLLLSPGYDYGQREVLFAGLLLPLLFVQGFRAAGVDCGRRVAIASGLVGGLGIALKPPFLLVWACAEIASLVAARARGERPRLVRAETLMIAAVHVVSLLAIVVFAPGTWSVLLEAHALYGVYDKAVPLLSYRIVPLAACVASLVAVRPKGKHLANVAPLISAAVAAFGVALLQRKGYLYHYAPSWIFALTALPLIWAPWLRQRGVRAAWANIGFATAVLALVLIPIGTPFPLDERRDLIRSMVRQLGNGERVLVFSSSVVPAFPTLCFTTSHHVGPYASLWPIPGFYDSAALNAPEFPYRTLDAMSAGERRFVDRVVTALHDDEPRLLFVDRGRFKQGFGSAAFEFTRYLSADPRFAVAMARYQPLYAYRPKAPHPPPMDVFILASALPRGGQSKAQ